MQGIIMAAGKGSRLSNFHKNLPKCYLKINNKPIIEHQLDALRSGGVKKIIIVVGFMKEKIMKDYSGSDIFFVENPFFPITNVLSSFWLAMGQLDESFYYMHADTIFDTKIFKDLKRTKGDIVLPIDFRNCGIEEMKVQITRGRIIEINKTMNPKLSSGEFIGLAKINKKVLKQLKKSVDKLIYQENFSAFFEHAIQDLIDEEKLKIIPMKVRGSWNEIDFEEDYVKAKSLFES